MAEEWERSPPLTPAISIHLNGSEESFPLLDSTQRTKFTPIASLKDEWVTLSLDGQQSRISLAQLQRYPDTMLGRMFGTARKLSLTRSNDDGSFPLDKTNIRHAVFQAALEYYEREFIQCPPDVEVSEIVEACEYLMIPVNMQTIKCRNLAKLMHYLSNRGAIAQFSDVFFPKFIMPILESCVLRGDRQAYLAFLYSDEVLNWDDNDPPPFDEDTKKVIFNSDLCRFLSFSENRELIKEIVQDRGFKKVKLGIEGFPIDMLHVDPHRTTVPENPYRYEQRPYIYISWEKEEKGNQHVNFQYVRKSSTGSSSGSTSSVSRKPGRGRWM